MNPEGPTPRRSLSVPKYTGTALLICAVLIAVGVASAAIGLNVFYVFVAIGLLFALERTLGDWIAEIIGPMMRRVLFAVLSCVVAWQLLAADGRLRSLGELLGLDQYWLVEMPFGGASVTSSGSPAPAAVRTEGVAGSTGVSPKSSSTGVVGLPGSTASGSATARSAPSLKVRSVSSSSGVRLEADVSGEGNVEGVVEFLINGRQVARGQVRNGRVQANLPDPGPGEHQVVVRFKGKGGVGDVTTTTTLVR